jgi:hypothetical protein
MRAASQFRIAGRRHRFCLRYPVFGQLETVLVRGGNIVPTRMEKIQPIGVRRLVLVYTRLARES